LKYIHTSIIGLVSFGILLIPSTLAQGITGITLQSAPNAVSVEWHAARAMTVDHYKVYYSRQSILQNNGRFDATEDTIGDETNLVILDLKNRGFVHGDTMYVTVAAVDTDGNERQELSEEAHTTVQVPGVTVHRSAGIGMINAVAESATSVRLSFSNPVKLPNGHPASFFTIEEEGTGILVNVLSAEQMGNTILLKTTPMNARSRYAVTAGDTLTSADGSAIDAAKRSAVFVARGEATPQVTKPIQPTPAVPAPTPEVTVPPIPELISAPDTVIQEMDITPPEDAKNLALTRELQSNGMYTVYASWSSSINSAGDLTAYHVYESDDRGQTFVGPTALVATVTSTTIANIPPGTLTLKLTAVDNKGNESKGIEKIIILPETGPALLLLLSGVGAGVLTMRRKR
jgi:hypothetical protein